MISQLGDMDKTIESRLQVHESTEIGGRSHATDYDLTCFDVFGQAADLLQARLTLDSVFRKHLHNTLVIDLNGALVLGLESTDGFSTLTDDGTNFLWIYGYGTDARSILGQFTAWFAERPAILSNMNIRARLALASASRKIVKLTPLILISICRAVMPSLVPATLKSMSPR